MSQEQGKALADKYNVDFVEVSAKESSNVERVFELLTGKVIERVGTEDKSKDVLKNLGRKEEKKDDGCC